MNKKAEYHIVELYRGRQGRDPQYYLWRTGIKRGFLPGLKLYDTIEEAKEGMVLQMLCSGSFWPLND